MPVALFLLNHELGEAQEALEVGQIYKFKFDLHEEVGHTTKCCHFGSMKFFLVNFFRTLIRACTGSFPNVYPAFYTKHIEVGQIFGLSKNGSWALVDTCSSFFKVIN